MGTRFHGPLDDADRLRRADESARSGIARLRDGNIRQAEYDFYKAVTAYPENALWRAYLALAMSRQGRAADAHRELQAALSLDPADQNVRAIQQTIDGGAAETVPAARASAQVRPAAGAQTGTPARGAAGQSGHAEAIAQMEARVAAAPNDSQLRRHLSTLYLRAGRLIEAKEQTRFAETLHSRRAAF